MVNRAAFDFGARLQPIWNQLMCNISRDPDFLMSTLNEYVLAGDPFTSRMMDLFRSVQQNGIAAAYSLAITRGDYIPNIENKLKLVEMNTISVSFAGLAVAARQFHRRMAIRLNLVSGPMVLNKWIPENHSLQSVARGLLKAQEVYGNGKNQSIILIVTEQFLANLNDVRMIEEEIDRQSDRSVTHIQATFADLVNVVYIGPNKELLLRVANKNEMGHLSMEVGVVYYRTGYSPEDFAEKTWWDVRVKMEHSRAIKCPNIGWHLAGVKQVQNVITQNPALLERWLIPDDAALLRQTLVGSFNVNDQTLQMVAAAPQNYVLKPNREGGGNNVFGKDIVPRMSELLATGQAGSYGLMEFIHQRNTRGMVIPPCVLELETLVDTFASNLESQVANQLELNSELGFYGIHLSRNNVHPRESVLLNVCEGHLLRTKRAEWKEIGVIRGYGALDSPILI